MRNLQLAARPVWFSQTRRGVLQTGSPQLLYEIFYVAAERANPRTSKREHFGNFRSLTSIH